MDTVVLERIEWVDSGLSYASTWLDKDVVIERAKAWNGTVVTVGQVIYEGADRIVVALSKDAENDTVAGAFLIWKGAIIERRTLE